MTIGIDIKEVLIEEGTSFTILRDSGNITGEYLDYETNEQVTKPFIQEFFLQAMMAHDTQAVQGDVIQFVTTGNTYLVMGSNTELFENAAIYKAVVLYKTNCQPGIYRPRDAARDGQYLTRTIWDLVKAAPYCLITTQLYGHDLQTDIPLGYIGVEGHELYIQSSIGIKVGDRVRISFDEYFRVKAVKKRRFSAVDVCDLEEETRPWTTTTTTTSSSTTTSTSSSSSTTTTAP